MPSREIRRLSKKKGDEHAKDKTQVEKRMQKRPVLYAFSVIIFTIIVIAFIGSGLLGSNNFSGANRMTFGTYNGESIYYDANNYFASQYQNIAKNTTQSDANSIRQIWQQAFEATVRHKAILLRAEQSGYYVTDKAIDKALLHYPAYVDNNGRFDEKLYQSKSRRFRDTTRTLIHEVLLEEAYKNDVLYGHYYSSKETAFFREMVTPERAFKFIDFTYSEYPDEKVIAYGRENLDDFRQILLSRIIMSNANLADANQILDKYHSEQSTFEDLAKLYSSGAYAEQGGDMGVQYFYQIRNFFEDLDDPTAQANEIFNLPLNETSAPIQVGDNWVIFRVNSEAEYTDLNSPDTIEAIRNYILTQKKGEVEDYVADIAADFKTLAAEVGFDAAAAEMGKAPVSETELFPINYRSYYFGKIIQVKGDDAGSLSAAADNEDFFKTAFALEMEEVSDPIKLDDKIIVLQLVEEERLDDDGWLLADGYYRTFVTYQNPAFMELVDEDNTSYIYLFMANGNIQDEFTDKVVDQKKLDDRFAASYAKYSNQGL